MSQLDETGKAIWPAKDYSVGAFIQHHFSKEMLTKYYFQFKARDHWLDIGCGDGSFTLEIAKEIPDGKILAIDPSQSMIDFANQQKIKPNNVTFRRMDAMDIKDREKYTVITAFWSLQWAPDITKVLDHVHRALKPGGRFFAIFPSPNCLHWTLARQVIKSGKFKSLKNFECPVRLPTLDVCKKQAEKSGFYNFHAEHVPCRILLPDLNAFRDFVKGIPFFTGQVPDSDIPKINEAMTEVFKAFCDEHFDAQYYFSDEVTILTGMRAPRVIELMPEQRELLIKANFPRGDLDTPRSQVINALGDEAHLGSSIKPHEKFKNQPAGDDNRLSQQTANNRDAQARADAHPELTPSPNLAAKNQAVARMTPNMTPKPSPGK